MPRIDEIFEKYKKDELPQLAERTRKDYARHLATLSRQFGSRNAEDLSLKELNAWMKTGGGPMQRNKQMACFSSTLASAVGWGWIDVNICKEVERNPTKARDKIVTQKEFEQARSKASPRLALGMDLAWHTGLLQGTLLSLTWDQVDEIEGVIRARYHRTGGKIEIPIFPELKEVLRRCRQIPTRKKSQYVLLTRGGKRYTGEGFRAMWQRNMRKHVRAGNDRFTFNDIQKTWAAKNKKAAAMQTGIADLEKVFEDYPHFDMGFRKEAAAMAPYYEVFYCLEQTIRKLIANTLEAAAGKDWWESDKIQQAIRQDVAGLVVRELDSAVRQRSLRMIDYTTFGQLTTIILQNWDLFQGTFKNRNAVGRVMAALNLQRGPIAHCCLMSQDEVERLKLLVRDWFELLTKPPRLAA